MAFANSLRSLSIGPVLRYLGTHAEFWCRVLGPDSASGLARACTCQHATSGHLQAVASRSFAAMTQLTSSSRRPYDGQQEQQQQHQQLLLQPQPQLSQQNPSAASQPTQPPSTGFKKTFYKRKLPCPPAIEFSSPEGRQLFQEALLEGSMTGFFKLMEQFNTQDEPAFCGLASLTMVLNALSIDPRRTWKGSWRWFHEAMLDCCRPLDTVKEEGITLYQASCLARCNGARVEVRPYGSTSLEEFRSEVEAVCRSGEEHIVVSYSRKAFLQTGDGHFSPIGGYHRGRDLALVLDVARFKYPPHWVPLPMLYHAMSYLDPETGRPRGYMRMASNPLLDSVLLTLDVRSDAWQPADRFVRGQAPELVQTLAAQGGLSGEDVVRRVVDAMPLASLDAFLVVRSGAPLAAATSSTAATKTSTAAATACMTEGGNGGGASSAAATAVAAASSGDLGSDAAAACATPEMMAAAVRRASEYGSAAAADAAAATASSSIAAAAASSPSAAVATASASSPPQSKAQHLERSGAAALPPEPAAKDAALGVPSHPRRRSLQYSSSATPLGGPASPRKSCGAGANGGGSCGSNGGGCAAPEDGGSSSGCSGVAAASAISCSSSSLMAAATAVITAHDRCIPLAQRQQLLDELRGMPLYTLVANHLAAAASADAAANAGPAPAEAAATAVTPHRQPAAGRYISEKVVMALLMQRPEVWPEPESWRDPAAGAQWAALLTLAGYSVVEAEVSYLREQLLHIDEVLQSGDINGTCVEHSSRLDCAAHGH